MMLENKKNVIAQMDQSQKEREEGLYESEKLLEQDLKKFMECFQSLKSKKTEVKEMNRELNERQLNLQRDLNDKDSELNLVEAKIREIKESIKVLGEQKEKIFKIMGDWNKDGSRPDEAVFFNCMMNFRNDIVDFTRRIEDSREDINDLNDIKSNQQQEIDKVRKDYKNSCQKKEEKGKDRSLSNGKNNEIITYIKELED